MPGSFFCFLHGGVTSNNCPGAQKAIEGEFYITWDPAVCVESGAGNGKCMNLYRNILLQ